MNEYAIVIDLGGTNFRLALVDRSFTFIDTTSIPTKNCESPENVIAQISHYVQRMKGKIGSNCGKIQGIGIGVPGPLDATRGLIYKMPNLAGWSCIPLKQRLEESLAMDVIVMNDADMAAMGEAACGAGRGSECFVMLTLGTGLGSSIIMNGKPIINSDGVSPELGHLPVFSELAQCTCGKYGHTESILSTPALWTYYSSLAANSTPVVGEIVDLFQWDKAGDVRAKDTIDHYARGLGRVIAVGAIAYSCKLFIIGGGISGSWSRIAPIVSAAIDEYGFSPLTDNLTISPGHLKGAAGLIGCAVMVFNESRT